MDRMYHAARRWFLTRKPPRRSAFPRPSIEILEDRLAPTGNLQALLGLSQIQAAYPAVTGAGYTVALLDTGVNYNLPSLGGGIGPGARVVYGYNFVNNTTNALDDNGHGTFLANMIGSSDPIDPGIAPRVQFADLKVLDSNMNGPWNAIDSALQWVIANKTNYNIGAVNLSLGSGDYTSDQFNFLENDLANLKNMGVFSAAASGNNYAGNNSRQGLSYPAVDPDVVAVGATWAGSYGAQTLNGATDNSTSLHQLASFTQRDNALGILAPGAWIQAIGMNGKETTFGGTSMAAAVVTGAAVLLHQALDQTGQSALTTEQNLLQLLQATGTAVVDNTTNTNVKPTGLTFEELNLQAALAAAAPPAAPTLGPIADQTMLVGQTISVTLPITHAANDAIAFSTQVVDLPLLAYQLDQQYSLISNGVYYTNYYGFNEKWIADLNGGWYWLMPDGEFRRFAGSGPATLQPANLLATLNGAYYANPVLLWNAPVASKPTTTLSLNGNTLSIASSTYWVGTCSIAVTASAGQHHPVTESFNVTVNPAPPALAPIANQTVTHANRNLTLPLSATEPGGGPVTYSAQVLPTNGKTPPVTIALQGNQLTLNPASVFIGTFTVQVSASDLSAVTSETFTVTVTDTTPVLTPIGNVTQSHGQKAVVNLSATDAAGDVLTYTAQAQSVNGQPPPLTVSVQGNQLTVQAQQPILGTYTIQVAASDGALSATSTFTVTLTNSPPSLSPVLTQTMTAGQTSLSVALPASDADNDRLTFQAVAQTPDATAYQLNQQYAFRPSSAAYYANMRGNNEKWLIGKNSQWYALLPSGKLYHWSNSITQTLTAANLVATLDPMFYTEPRLLWNAAPPIPPALTFSFQGNQLTIQRPTTLTGVFFINVTVNDGWLTTPRAIEVTMN